MRLQGNIQREQDGNSTQPSANDNQMDEMMSSAIDVFLGSSRQTYDEFIQNFTQLTAADIAAGAGAEAIPPADTVSTLPSAVGHLLSNSRLVDVGLPRNGIFRAGIPDSITASRGPQDSPSSFVDITSEFPGRDEPPAGPPVIATGNDELEEEILDAATASYSGVFSPNSSGRNLQVDNFLGNEAEDSDYEKGDKNSEKRSNFAAYHEDDDDIAVYQASFLQTTSKYSKSEKNQANQLQQTIDKAQKNSINISQQNLNRCSTAIADAEENLAASLYSPLGPCEEPGGQPDADTDDTDNDLATGVGHYRHIPVRVTLRASEEDLLDIIGDDESDQENDDLSPEAVCDIPDASYENFANHCRVMGAFDNRENFHLLSSNDFVERRLLQSGETSESLYQHGDAIERSNTPLNKGREMQQSDIPELSIFPQSNEDGSTAAECKQLSSCELITDAEIDKIVSRHSQCFTLSDAEDEESSPVFRDYQREILNVQEDSEEALIYNSGLDSCNVGEVEGETEQELENSVTNIRELSYSAKPLSVNPESLPQAAMNSETDPTVAEPCAVDDVQAFELDEDFDYDNVTLTPKFNEAEMEYLRKFLPSPK